MRLWLRCCLPAHQLEATCPVHSLHWEHAAKTSSCYRRSVKPHLKEGEYMCYLEFPCKDFYLLPCLLMHSIVGNHRQTVFIWKSCKKNHGFLGFVLNVLRICFVAELVPSLATDKLSGWLLSFRHHISCLVLFFKHFITFWNYKMFWAHVIFSLCRPWNQSSLQGTLAPSVGE